jgi:hypothetical protein
MDRGDCAKTRAELKRMGVVKPHPSKPELIGINKHYQQWKEVVKHHRGGEPPPRGVVNHLQRGWENATHIKKEKEILKEKENAAPKAPPDPRVRVLNDKWAALYLKAKGIKCAHLAAAAKVFKLLLVTLAPEQIERHLIAYLAEPNFRGHHVGSLPDFIAKKASTGKVNTRGAGLGPEGTNPYTELAKENCFDLGGTNEHL